MKRERRKFTIDFKTEVVVEASPNQTKTDSSSWQPACHNVMRWMLAIEKCFIIAMNKKSQ
jgi:hypothetical protein